MTQARALAFALAIATLCFPAEPRAQSAGAPPERIPAPGRALASSDDATSARVNPANLLFVPGSELRWTGVYLDDNAVVPGAGNVFELATRIPFINLATGLRLDLVEPPAGAGASAGDGYQWLTFGVAARAGSGALGATLQSSFSRQFANDDLTSFSVGYSSRPFNWLGVAAVGHDLNSPDNGLNRIDRSFEAGVALRPLSSRAVEIGLESRIRTGTDTWVPRGTLGVDIPFVGRLRGDFAMSHPLDPGQRSWLATAGISAYLQGLQGSAEFGGGAITGTTLGAKNEYGGYASVATRTFREPDAYSPSRYAIRIRLESTPSPRVHAAFLAQLWSIAEEEDIDAVIFELRASPAASLAHLEELRDAVFHLRRSRKRTLCHLEDASGGELLFCSAANRTLINPGGSIRFSGMRSRSIYFARALANLGIKAEYVRIGDHKSAPEQFTESQATETAAKDRVELLQQFERGFSEGISVGRGISVAEVRKILGDGPFTARESIDQGLADEQAFDDQIEKSLKRLLGRATPLKKDVRSRLAPKTFGRDGVVAIVHVDGEIVSGRNKAVPFFGVTSAGSYTLAETLKAVRENEQIKAVVVRVESPGGSSTAADVIWRQVKLLAKAKPTIVSMGAVAASGGYYLSAPATRIFANPLTVTGSIGIYYLKADVSTLLDKVGVDVETYKTRDEADAESFFRPFSAEERESQQERIRKFYDLFLSRVAEGRKMKTQDVDAVGQGKVWTGEQALEQGLVDELGGLRQALAYARKAAHLPDDAPTIDLPTIPTSLLSRLLGLPTLKSELAESLGALPAVKKLSPALNAVAPLVVHDLDEPLARMEFSLEPLQ